MNLNSCRHFLHVSLYFSFRGHPFMTYTKNDQFSQPPTPTIYKSEQYIYCLKTTDSANKWQISRLTHNASVWTSEMYGLLNDELYHQVHDTVKHGFLLEITLTHLFPMHPFCTSWKHQKNLQFSDVLKEKRKGVLGTNRLRNNFFTALYIFILKYSYFSENYWY